ncbi:MAG: hypothetical protein PHO79_09325 [Desulfoplanes sp.]|nr:hypothetical protein [Desulfoplanes sp.]MDD4650195.1 hypothetical protein [Desulfoplanes sp.]
MRLDFNAKREQELMANVDERHKILSRLDTQLELKSKTLRGLLEQAKAYAKSAVATSVGDLIRRTILEYTTPDMAWGSLDDMELLARLHAPTPSL